MKNLPNAQFHTKSLRHSQLNWSIKLIVTSLKPAQRDNIDQLAVFCIAHILSVCIDHQLYIA